MDNQLEEEPLVEQVKQEPPKPKAKRAPSAYNAFVKEHFSKVKDLPTKERFKKLGEMWKNHKEQPVKKKRKKKE